MAKKGDNGRVKELLRKVIAKRPWKLETVEVLASVWFERMPDQGEILLPFLVHSRTQRILAQEISRRTRADIEWLCGAAENHPRAVGVVLHLDPALLASDAQAREVIARSYLNSKTDDVQASGVSLK